MTGHRETPPQEVLLPCERHGLVLHRLMCPDLGSIPEQSCTLCYTPLASGIEGLIEGSSLGDPGAKSIRARTPRDVRDRIVAEVYGAEEGRR